MRDAEEPGVVVAALRAALQARDEPQLAAAIHAAEALGTAGGAGLQFNLRQCQETLGWVQLEKRCADRVLEACARRLREDVEEAVRDAAAQIRARPADAARKVHPYGAAAAAMDAAGRLVSQLARESQAAEALQFGLAVKPEAFDAIQEARRKDGFDPFVTWRHARMWGLARGVDLGEVALDPHAHPEGTLPESLTAFPEELCAAHATAASELELVKRQIIAVEGLERVLASVQDADDEDVVVAQRAMAEALQLAQEARLDSAEPVVQRAQQLLDSMRVGFSFRHCPTRGGRTRSGRGSSGV